MIGIWLLACATNDVDSGDEPPNDEQSEPVSCAPQFALPDRIDMGSVPAMGLPLQYTIDLVNTSNCTTVLLGNPDEWVSGNGFFLLDYPEVLIPPEETVPVHLGFQPHQQGSFQGTLQLLFDTTAIPAAIDLVAQVSAPKTTVFVGDGLHRATTIDYGESIVENLATQQPNTEQVQRGICWGNDRFLAVGGVNERRFWTSFDGFEWVPGSAEGTGLRDCAYGNDRFVTFDADVPLYSLAGMQWEEGVGTPWMTNTLRAITYDGNVFVAVGDQGRIAITQTAEQWDTDISIGNFNLHSIAFGQDVLLAVGSYGAVVRSTDHGQTWTEQRIGDATFQRVLYTGNQFIISDGARVYTSIDGDIWSTIDESGIKPIVAFGTLLFGIKERELYRSFNNGETWNHLNTFQYPTPFFAAVTEGGP